MENFIHSKSQEIILYFVLLGIAYSYSRFFWYQYFFSRKREAQIVLTNTLSFSSIHKTLASNLVLYKIDFPRIFCYALVAKK